MSRDKITRTRDLLFAIRRGNSVHFFQNFYTNKRVISVNLLRLMFLTRFYAKY